MKKLLAALALISISLHLLAVPARHIHRELTLSDGRIVTDAVFCGNEQFHYWLAPNGVKYVQTEENTFETISNSRVAAMAERAQIEQATMIRQANPAPRGLVILANFKDVKFRPTNTSAAIDSMLNGESYTYHRSIGSARKYFQDQSKGLYDPIFDVVGPIELPDSVRYYGKNQRDYGSDQRAADMVLRSCEAASRLPGVDFSRYDSNNDGMIDLVFIIYAGYGEADSQIADLIWPASWTMGAAVSSGNTHLPRNSSFRMYTFHGKTIGYFAYTCELNYHNTIQEPTPGYDEANPLRTGIGTFCHEFSHVLGLPDYYDTQNGVNYTECLTPGNWDLMDQGNYNIDGYVPANYSVHEKWWMGWQAPQLLNRPAHLSLWADSTSYYITHNGRASSAIGTDTIYYIENRQQTGWDMGIPGHGLYVLRVVYNENLWDTKRPNDIAHNPRYMFVAADGTYTWNDGETGLQGDAGDTYPGRANINSCTLFPAYPITEITEQDGVIHLTFMGGDTTAQDTGTSTALGNILPTQLAEGVYSITGHYMGSNSEGCARGIYIVRKNGKSEKLIIQ